MFDMKKLILLFCSASPFLLGYLLNYVTVKFDLYGSIILAISLSFTIYWFFIGYASASFIKSPIKSIVIGNIFAIADIILILFQELVLDRYFPNAVGTYTQMFYFPMLSVAFKVENMLHLPLSYGWMGYILSFILMLSVYYMGYYSKTKNTKELPL